MLQIPPKFKEKLSKAPLLDGQITSTVAVFSGIYADNKLYFFPEYTNHGLEHINSVLRAAEEIIDDHTIDKILTSQDIAVLILSIILHDLGMQLSFDTFKSLIEGKNDDSKIDVLDEKTWIQLWDEYLDEAKKFSGKQLRNIFGTEFHTFRKPNLDDKLNITEGDKLLIGEFIRRHHPRIAHEVALKGLVGKKGEILDFARDTEVHIKKLAGIVARSHGMEIRDTFEYLKTLSEYEWANPHSVNVIFLMVVLRIADYFQFDATRIDKPLLKLKTFSSPISQIEHDKHLSIDFVKPFVKDPETLYIEAKPDNSDLYLKLEKLFKDIQYELDISWAVLGEIYGKEKNEQQPKIKYRRIKSNLDKHGSFVKSVSYIPERMVFDYDSDLAKLLIAPLYGDNPTFGVRELLQNAIDACRERELEEKRLGNEYEPLIEVAIIKENEETYFTIKDNGKGMTLHELKNYFLKAGSSFRKSIDWQKKYTNEEGKSEVMRSGRFGVGVLAAFLLGDEIEVTTKCIHSTEGYIFSAKLDTEQIDVKKVQTTVCGTILKIKISKKIHEILIDNFQSNIPKWDEWYKFTKPNIKYFPEEKSFLKPILINIDAFPKQAHSISHKYFEKIVWQYESHPITTCNGIVIPQVYKPNFIAQPTIHIIDNNALLNLSLNREQILSSPPFEDELLEDIFKDLIAFTLIQETPFELKSNNISKRNTINNKIHPSHIDLRKIYYYKDGFTIHQNYFLENLKNKFIHINLCLPSNPDIKNPYLFLKSIDLRKPAFDNVLFSISCEYFETFKGFYSQVGEAKSYLQLHNPARVYTRSGFYKEIFSNIHKVHSKVKEKHKIDIESDNWVCWSYLYNKPIKFYINELKNFQILWIKEEELRNINSVFGDSYNIPILNILMKKYFGENYIIPYDLEDRKKMYPKAFEELEPYMRKYLSTEDE